MPEIRGQTDGRPQHVAVAVSRYNETVTRGLLDGARAALAECGVADDDLTVVHVPGALELPVVLAELAASGRYDALVALGAVIRGETDHYHHVSEQTLHGCGRVALDARIAVGIGVLTCETLALARDRSGPGPKNKGAEAARSAVETARLLAAIRAQARAARPPRRATTAPGRTATPPAGAAREAGA